MTAEHLKEILVFIPATILASATLVSSLRNSKKLHKLTFRVNGRLDELLKATAEAKLNEGRLHGRQIERDCQRRLSEGKCPIIAIEPVELGENKPHRH